MAGTAHWHPSRIVSPVDTPAVASIRDLVGRRVTLPGYFVGAVTVGDARLLGSGAELRVRLPTGDLDEAVLSREGLTARCVPLHAQPQAHGRPKLEWVQQDRPLVKVQYIFNVEQTEGLKLRSLAKAAPEWKGHERTEALMRQRRPGRSCCW